VSVTEAEIRERFTRAVEASFGYLVQAGFKACGVSEMDSADRREKSLVARYTRDRLQIEMRMNIIFLTISVFVRLFPGPAPCDSDDGAVKVLNLEGHLLTPTRPPLKWMRTLTLRDEALKSIVRYSKQMLTHLEEAIDYLARALQSNLTALPREP
jgi:hypothetical protein